MLFLVAALAIVVKSDFQVELLLVIWELLLALDGGFIVTIVAFFDRVTLLPDVFAALVLMMTISTLDPVFRRVLFVGKSHRAFGVLGPKRVLDGNNIGDVSSGAEAEKNHSTQECYYREDREETSSHNQVSPPFSFIKNHHTS